MNLEAYIISLEAKQSSKKKFTPSEKYKFYTLRQFISFCDQHKVYDIVNIDNKIWSNFVRYLSQQDAELTKYNKLLTIKKFLENHGSQFIPNPRRAYVTRTNKHKSKS